MPYPTLPPYDQHIIVSAMRHCREVQSFLTRRTINWVMEHWTILDERTQAQLIRDARLDTYLNAQLTQEERERLEREQPEWEAYLHFIERKMND